MSPDQFLEFARVLPEPFLLITGLGEILASNRPTASLIGCKSKEIQGKNLCNLVTETSEKVISYLQACSRSRQMVLGCLNFILPDGETLICRVEGAVVQPSSPTSPAVNILRLESRAAATTEFLLLNQKINELTKEIHQRQEVQAEIVRKNQELQSAIQQLKATQIQLIQSEKMSSLGQLVAGIAHEINNPVNFIHGNLVYTEEYIQTILELLQLYQEEYPDTSDKIKSKIEKLDLNFILEDVSNILQSMRVGTHRIREIVLSLRNFSRLDEAELKKVDIHEGIESTLVILQHRLNAQRNRPAIQVIKDYSNLPSIQCYPSQLNQVFMNILVNAIDALEKSFTLSHSSLKNNHKDREKITKENPTIWISTKQANPNYAIKDNFNSHITISIKDNGSGIPQQIRQNVFDPFFTTKPVGEGTGLGLSISYQIIKKTHGGQLHCISAEGQGTEFIIELPIHEKFGGHLGKFNWENMLVSRSRFYST
ncbi:MAG TPA: PAS domain-containing sensor histidine kinase [Cyanobacteria bacterium UBA11149]|nr:PAS domain-containing sensor histidine kinase [Cyanobacteria bacterium UBA11367]HBE58489.1 PAS domain-containing sensor histidine kinase [Cyanobacteria bacterium UBA11366]HBK65015.1 PAS domain-containing sensor histidine kinase [Cyanobacteria bacterium UBA11166]HBR75012.1 PAS domain-containing sensor histidine kinase [Cyanobacteria bacterium UBA11159]HBS68865.1 PAS domain-containing sensor histidine kinase [Cyanobacteria bacterium UBA11153]HBW87750.1 PAS domain-containing sensor histidine k